METLEDFLLGIALFAGAVVSWWIFAYRRKRINEKATLKAGQDSDSRPI